MVHTEAFDFLDACGAIGCAAESKVEKLRQLFHQTALSHTRHKHDVYTVAKPAVRVRLKGMIQVKWA